MQRFATLVAALGCLCLMACNKETPPTNKGGINITAPGVNVHADPNGGASVNAPNVNITVTPPK